jgi:hypothetical protein
LDCKRFSGRFVCTDWLVGVPYSHITNPDYHDTNFLRRFACSSRHTLSLPFLSPISPFFFLSNSPRVVQLHHGAPADSLFLFLFTCRGDTKSPSDLSSAHIDTLVHNFKRPLLADHTGRFRLCLWYHTNNANESFAHYRNFSRDNCSSSINLLDLFYL